MNIERRQHARIAFLAPAQLVTGQGKFDAQVLDLSFKGALVRTPPEALLSPGDACTLRLPLDPLDDDIRMEMRIAHVDARDSERRAGLLCQSIDIDSMTHLRRLVELNLGDAELLEREVALLVRGA